MAHITLSNEELPGIVGLLDYRPETAKPLLELAEVLLRGPSGLTSGEREIIAASPPPFACTTDMLTDWVPGHPKLTKRSWIWANAWPIKGTEGRKSKLLCAESD